jgi:hypothetical protein
MHDDLGSEKILKPHLWILLQLVFLTGSIVKATAQSPDGASLSYVVK